MQNFCLLLNDICIIIVRLIWRAAVLCRRSWVCLSRRTESRSWRTLTPVRSCQKKASGEPRSAKLVDMAHNMVNVDMAHNTQHSKIPWNHFNEPFAILFRNIITWLSLKQGYLINYLKQVRLIWRCQIVQSYAVPQVVWRGQSLLRFLDCEVWWKWNWKRWLKCQYLRYQVHLKDRGVLLQKRYLVNIKHENAFDH